MLVTIAKGTSSVTLCVLLTLYVLMPHHRDL